ncbi:mitogen-activated protein kinase kinase kinase 3-like, partial [Oncorhynchus nerka]|uniref:mitogen-activated protein kinase kinase kinase 3-like n=1 Tax=Oncorhynchus nerka TaxID=8023 RepID=UPI0031B829EC
DLRVKLEHEREKRIIPFQRPLKIKELLQKVTEAFGQQMDLFYTDKERLVPLKSQEDLDKAVLNVGSSSLLRLLLKTPKNNHFLQVGSWDKQSELRSSRSLGDLKGCTLKSSERVRKHSTGSLHAGRRSPPPGSVPEEQQQIARQGSFTSIHTEGEFIPEGLDHKGQFIPEGLDHKVRDNIIFSVTKRKFIPEGLDQKFNIHRSQGQTDYQDSYSEHTLTS